MLQDIKLAVVRNRSRAVLSSFLFILLFGRSVLFADELRIGTTLCLSGPYATYGRQALHGIEMALDEINANGGVNGSKVKLFVEDFGTLDLKRALMAARKLIDVDKVNVLLPLIVEDAEVIVPITSKIPMFTMVVGCGARKCAFNIGEYNVRAAAAHDSIIERLVSYAQSKNVKHSCAIVAESTYFEGYGRYIEELSKKAGNNVTYVTVPLSNSDDYRSIATRFKYANCDAIYSWIPMGTIGSFFRRVRESGSKALLFGIVESDNPEVLKAAGSAAEGVVFARFSLGSKEFQDRFAEKYKEQLLRPTVPTYDGVKLLLELIAKVGTSPQKLREAILNVKNKPATNGEMTYTSEGERTGEQIELMTIVNGKPVAIGN